MTGCSVIPFCSQGSQNQHKNKGSLFVFNSMLAIYDVYCIYINTYTLLYAKHIGILPFKRIKILHIMLLNET